MPFNPLDLFLTRQKCPSCGAPIQWSKTKHGKKADAKICNICEAILKD